MLFNSIPFLIFLPIVFVLYWFVFRKNLKAQNILLLVASYFFYASWDYRFLFLLMFSTMLDYVTGIKMGEAETAKSRKFWFWLSIVVNLGFLGVFKYYNFFVASFADLLSNIGLTPNVWTLQVILPVGISFYTFHGLSYVIDIYYERIRPEKNFIGYSVFVCYFPLLVAGPIERATHLLPQIKVPRRFNSDEAIKGVEQILWGFFKKVVIADTVAGFVTMVYDDPASYSSNALILASIGFSFQIYCDFSGYSDIAIGTSKLLGIDLLRNFNFPYLSRNIAEFWRRWHISLSSWFRDYLYLPLGGSKIGPFISLRNIFIVFLVSGIWHGANWTFVIWGAVHACLFIPSFLMRTNNEKQRDDLITYQQRLPHFVEVIQVVITFCLVTVAWVFFRAQSVSEAFLILRGIFSNVQGKELTFQNTQLMAYLLAFTAFFLVSAYFLYRQNSLVKQRKRIMFSTSLVLLVLITLLGEFSQHSFIYFQF
jgi:alginate O-acetyltransferase complex protein AlgI